MSTYLVGGNLDRASAYWWAECNCAMGWPDGGRVRLLRALEGAPERTRAQLRHLPILSYMARLRDGDIEVIYDAG